MRPTSARPSPRRLLDAASGPLSAAARTALETAFEDGWADPGKLYSEGRRARALLDAARATVATVLAVRPSEVLFVPSAASARQLGLLGLLHGRRRVGPGLVLSAVEHSALLSAAQWHQDRGGHVTTVGVDRHGRLELAEFGEAVAAPEVAAACVQSANGEVATRQPVAAARQSAAAAGVPLLVDASAAIGWEDPPTEFDVLVADASTWGGPPLGVLVVRTGVRWRHDGPAGLAAEGPSPGSTWVPLAAAAAAGLTAAEATRVERAARARELIARLRAAADQLVDTEAMGDPQDRLPHVVTWSSPYVDGEALATELDRRGFAVGAGSACTASRLAPSHVLAAMGVLSHGNLRVTLPLEPEPHDVTALIAELPDVLTTVAAR